MIKRCSGVLMHITSLPNTYGIGSFGKEAYDFVDFLYGAGQKIWQILPLGHTGGADSPYQCYSAFAGNPLLIAVDKLLEKSYIEENDISDSCFFEETFFDTEKVRLYKEPLLRKAALRFLKFTQTEDKNAFSKFCNKHKHWLDDYSMFVVLKAKYKNKPWYEWPAKVKMRNATLLRKLKADLSSEIKIIKAIQFLFYTQWQELKEYANKKEIHIFGDIPLYIAHDSADAWAQSELFLFDKDKNPIAVAGVPPDYFSETGQLWGNPLFDWDNHEKTHFKWWMKRFEQSYLLYDILRIDHFRGLSTFWRIPFGEKTAVNGRWVNAPGSALLKLFFKKYGSKPVVAEDLGDISEDVLELRNYFGLPGMKILHFAFNSTSDNEYLPHNYQKNCVVYTGTHDNDTSLGWFEKSSEKEKEFVSEYLHFFNDSNDNISWELVRLTWSSVANLSIAPMQDLLGLGSDARMNEPGKIYGFWQWRIKKNKFSSKLQEKLKKMTLIYNR